MALGQPERGIDELRAALDGIRRLRRRCGEHGGPWERRSLRTGQDDEAAAAVSAAASIAARTFAATLAPERSGPLLAAEPRERSPAAGSS